jgi:hypothetical protein
MVKIWKVNARLCNVLTLYLCTLFLVQGGKWTGYGLSRGVFVTFASAKIMCLPCICVRCFSCREASGLSMV